MGTEEQWAQRNSGARVPVSKDLFALHLCFAILIINRGKMVLTFFSLHIMLIIKSIGDVVHFIVYFKVMLQPLDSISFYPEHNFLPLCK